MTAVTVSLATFAVILLGIAAGVILRARLPKRYLRDETGDTVKLCAGVIATLTALTLGLLIASAKSSYDARVTQIRQIAANLILSDRLLTLYGGDAAQEARIRLRATIAPVVDQIWTETDSGASRHAFHSASETEEYVNALYRLTPQNDTQKGLRERVMQTYLELARSRLSLFSQMNTLLPPALLVVLAFWFAVLFAAYTMYAEVNVVSLAALVVCAVSVSGAMFLMFQMNNPFSGIMAIPRVDFVAMLPPL